MFRRLGAIGVRRAAALRTRAPATLSLSAVGAADAVIIDDRRSGGLEASIGTSWRGISDRVMGGVSASHVAADRVAGRACLRLTGDVRLDNNGGFIQAALDLSPTGALDASACRGVRLSVYGNGETYNVHLRTADTVLPWQSYRHSFAATAQWREVRLPFGQFRPHRLSAPLDVTTLRRLGVVAIGRAFHADVCIGDVTLY